VLRDITTSTTYSDVVTCTTTTEATYTPSIGYTFYLYVDGLSNPLENGYFQYFYNSAISNEGYAPGSGATEFVVDRAGQLFTSGLEYVAGTFAGGDYQNVYFTSPTGGYPSGFEPMMCNTENLELSCGSVNGGGQTLFINTAEDPIVGYLSIGSMLPADGEEVPINIDPA